MPRLARSIWPPVLCAIALTCGVASFVYFDQYPLISGGRRGTPLAPWASTIISIPLASPIFIAAATGVALLRRARFLLTIAEIHAALFAALVVLSWVPFSPGHSSFGDSFSEIILGVLTAVLLVELAVVLGAAAVSIKDGFPALAFIGLSAALIGGWALGVLIWSELMPARVAAAAEQAAGDKPYCLDVVGHPAQSARDLTGIAMKAPNQGGWTSSFHALLAIGDPAERRYMNWSYRSGRFEPVSQAARESLHLDKSVRCGPVPHLTRGWR